MCISKPNVTTPAPVLNRSDSEVTQERDRRLSLGRRTGGQLATQLQLGNNQPEPRKLLLGQ